MLNYVELLIVSTAIAKNKVLTFNNLGLSINGDFICSWESSFIKNCLVEAKKFYYKGRYFNFSAHKDVRGYWTASKRINGKLYKKRLGDNYTVDFQRCWDADTYFHERDDVLSQSDRQYLLKIEKLDQQIARLEKENEILRKRLSMGM